MGTCETCRYAKILWRKGDKYKDYSSSYMHDWKERERFSTSVECRRHAPRIVDPKIQNVGWPYALGDDWCGEYQAADGAE